MRSGLVLLAIFAAAWASAGLLAAGHAIAWALVPALISAALLVWAFGEPATAHPLGPHVRRLVARWSIMEGAAIIAAAYALQRFHRIDAMFSACAAIVGLHFLPLARCIPIRLYYATGAGLMLLGLGGLALPAAERPMTIGLCAAVILWATIIARVHELRQPVNA
jgi:hypothetical protein